MMGKRKLLELFVIVGCAITYCSAQSCYGRQRGHLAGNITLGFLFSFHGFNASTKECGQDVPNLENIQLLEAATMVLRNAGASGVTFGLNSWDTCSSSRAAVEASIAYLTDQMDISENTCSAGISKPGIVASLDNGGQGEAVARLVNEARVPLISFASSQSSLTEDGQFPYFLRTSPRDEFEATGLVKLLRRMYWSYVIAINLDTVEDKAALEAFSRSASEEAICVSSPRQFSLNSSTQDMDHLISNITSTSSANVVVVFASSFSVEKLTAAIQRAGDSAAALQFVFSHRALLGISSNTARLHGVLGFRIPLTTTDDGFDTYFKNLTPDTVNAAENPWFADYWQKKYQCNLDGSAYMESCSSVHVQRHKDIYERHPYVSNVIDAVRAYTTSIQTSNWDCSVMGQSSLCDSVVEYRQQILSHIRQVNFTKENGQRFAFTPSGDIYYSRLELVNYKMGSNGNLLFEAVGNFERGELSLNVNRLELMNGDGMNPGRSVCGPSCMDPACQETGPQIYIPGDIILGGFFSIHNWNDSEASCGTLDESGVKRIEAMMYALDKINNDDTILPGLTLGIDGFDTCANARRAGHQALQLVSKGQFGQSGSGQRPIAGGLTEHVYGMIGPNGDEECEFVNKVLNVYGTPMISYAAKAVSLSYSTFYRNFARTVSSDAAIGVALLQAAATKQWNYVQSLRSATGENWFNPYLLQNGPRMGVCTTSSQIIPSADNVEEMDKVFQTLTDRPTAKVVFISATKVDTRAILKEFQMRDLFGQFYLVLVSDWSADPSLQQDFADIAPGITYIAESKRSYPDFREYFSGLNPSENLRNLWFAEYWADKFQCNLPNAPSVYAEDCTGFESLTPDDGEDMRIAQTVDSVYAMARAISYLHELYCPGETHVCPEMILAPGDELFRRLTSRLSAFSSVNDGYQVVLNGQGDALADYEIYNIQRTADGSLQNVKVGDYKNYVYQAVENTDIIVYRKDGESFIEISDSKSVCEGVCSDCKQIEQATTAEVSGGDIWIGGLFELHEPAPDKFQCKDTLITYNVQLLEAFLFAVDQVNLDSTILPELKLGAIAFDTCGSGDRAQREVINFVSGTVDYRTGYLRDRPTVVGIIGGQTSDTSLTVADALTTLGVNQISYAATTAELSDASKFPYFLRTVPSDDKQAAAIVDLLQAMNWQYVSIVFSNNSYGTDLWNGVKQKLASTSICVAVSLKLLSTYEDTDYDNVAQQLQINPLAKVVLLLTSDIDTMQVLMAAERMSISGLQWIGTDTWGDRDYIIEKAPVTSQGALILRFRHGPEIQAFKDYFTNLQPYRNPRNPWWMTFLEDTFKCSFYGSTRYNVSCPWQVDFESVYKQATEISYVMDAVQLFATGLHQAMIEICPGVTSYICDDLALQPAVLHRYIQNTTISRPDGSAFKLDENGDGEAYYDVLHVEVNGTEVQPSYVKVGNWTSGSLNLDGALSSVSSTCVGRCAECYMDKPDSFVRVPGQLQILGLFATHDSGDHIRECGELRDAGIVNLEAMLFAIDQINAEPTILNGITLGATAFDTCRRGSRGLRDLSSVFSGTRSFGQDITQNTWSLIAGVIGGDHDDVTLTTASLSKQYKYVQVSYGFGATSGNRDNLLTAGPTVNNQVLAVVQLLQHFQWKYASVISSLSEYRIHQRDIFINEATNRGICIGTTEEITTQSLIQDLLQKIYENSDQNVVVLFTDEEDTVRLMEEVDRRSQPRHLTWVIAFNDQLENKMLSSSFLGAFLVNDEPKVVPEFENYLSSLTASSNQRNPWFQEAIGRKYGCNRNAAADSEGCSAYENATLQFAREDYGLSTNVINAVFAVAYGMEATRDKYCSGTAGLCAAFVGLSAEELQQGIKETSFMTLDGSTFNFQTGSSEQQFTIWNNKEIDGSSQFVKVGAWMSGTIAVENIRVSLYNSEGQLTTTPVLSQCPDTKPTDISLSTTNTFQTARPNGGSGLTSAWFLVLVAIGIVGMVLAAIMIVIFLFHWKQAVAQALSPFLYIMLLTGVILAYLLNPMFASPTTVVSCAFQRVWPGIAFAFCQVAILLLAVRLYRTSKEVHAISAPMPTFLLSTSSQVGYFMILIALQFVIALEWLILRPPEVVAYATEEMYNDTLVAVCFYGASTTGAFAYVYLLLVLALIAVVPTWKKKYMISSLELISFLAVIIGSMILLIVWALVDHFAPESYRHPGKAIIATIKATSMLVFVMPRAKAVLRKQNFSSESAGMQFREYPAAEDLEDDVSTTSSKVQLTESKATYKV